jgi:predicted ATPase
MAIYSPEQYHSHATRFGGHDPGVCGKGHNALLLWLCGYADQAVESSQQALALAQDLSHTPSQMHALNWAMWLHQFRREPRRVLERADAMIALAAEQGSALYLATGTVFCGWAMATNGHIAEGIARLHKGLEMHRATGAEFNRSYFVALQAAAYGTMGQAVEGLSLLADALALADKTGECWCEAELHRIKGTLLQSLGDQTQAEVCLHQAVDTARRQSAKLFELRAATSLGRLWQGQGKTEKARDLLAPVYGWFTEGFETADLKEARVLLDELER